MLYRAVSYRLVWYSIVRNVAQESERKRISCIVRSFHLCVAALHAQTMKQAGHARTNDMTSKEEKIEIALIYYYIILN